MKKKIVKWGVIVVAAALIIGGSAAFYLFNMPHRDIQATPVDYSIEAEVLVNEYLQNAASANEKYLQEEGDSKILAVTGTVYLIDTDLNNQKVVLLKKDRDKAGVSCTFMESTNTNAASLQKGDKVTIKGVIRSGAGYDEDLDLFEDVILEKCDIYSSKK